MTCAAGGSYPRDATLDGHGPFLAAETRSNSLSRLHADSRRFCLTKEGRARILNHMVKHLSLGGEAGALDATFGALSDATRRGILARLALGESSVSELAAPYEMSLPAVSKHLRVLENAGLVTRHKDGRVHRCRLIAEPMKDAAEWIERYRMFWEEQFDALERYLAETGALTTSPKPDSMPAREIKGIEAISGLNVEPEKKAKKRSSRRKKS